MALKLRLWNWLPVFILLSYYIEHASAVPYILIYPVVFLRRPENTFIFEVMEVSYFLSFFIPSTTSTGYVILEDFGIFYRRK
jgi:hypothetical protein